MIAWRGVVHDGEVWAWPTVLWDHKAALSILPWLAEGCRWRQWEPGGAVDFDPGASDEDKRLVEEWIGRSLTEPSS